LFGFFCSFALDGSFDVQLPTSYSLLGGARDKSAPGTHKAVSILMTNRARTLSTMTMPVFVLQNLFILIFLLLFVICLRYKYVCPGTK
jgi:hypothetical protein